MKVFVLGLLAVFWGNSVLGKTLYTFNGGGTTGDWNNASTWTTDPTGSTRVAPSIPTTDDNVVITNSFTVSITSPQVTANRLTITIQRGGVLDLTSTSTNAFSNTLSRLAGQGTLRVARAYFPAVTTNDFDDANTGTVEFYNLAGTPTLPSPTTGQYNNVRLLNTTTTAYTAQLDNDLTLNGSLTLVRTNITSTTSLVNFTLGKAANDPHTLTVQGDITVGAGTALGVSNATAAHTLKAGGSFINNGTVNLHNGTTNDDQVALLLFTGNADANFACNGPTDLDILQVNKGIDSQVLLNVTASALGAPAQGNLRLNHRGNGRLLALVNGVAKFGRNIYLAKIHNGSVADSPANSSASGWWELGSSTTSPTLWIDGAQIFNDNASAFIIYGTYRISNGLLSTKTPDAMVIREDGQVLIEGGTTTVNKFRPSSTSSTHRGSFIITSGVFSAEGSVPFTGEDDFGRFSIPYVTQSFRMTGGTIRVQNPSNGDGLFHIGVNSNNAIVTGGTIEVLLPTSATICRLSTTAPLWNLTVRKPAAGGSSIARIADIAVPTAYKTGATTAAQPLTVLNNFTIGGTNPATFDANSKDVTIQGTLSIATNGTYLPGNNTTTFSGGQDQQLVNNGAIGAATTPNTFYNWVVNKSAGTLVLAGAASTYTVDAAGTLSLLNGVLSDNGSTINVLGNMVNSASHTSGGGTGSITLAGSTKQTVSGNDQGVFGNLNIKSKLAEGAVAVEFTANMNVANALTFQSKHLLAIGANRLSLTNVSPSDAINGTFSNLCFVQTAGNQSDLGLQKTYGGADNFIFPVGTGTKYAPANVILSVATALGKYGQVSVSPVNTRNPFVTNGTAGSLAYYWKVRSTGFGTIPSSAISMRFTMTNSDASGTLTDYVPGRYAPVAWTPQYTDKNLVVESDPTSIIRFNALNQFEGEYTAGLPTATGAFGPVTAYYSIANGAWNAASTWSTVGFGGTAASVPPGANNPVFIGSASGKIYHTVTVAANAAKAGSLVIDRGSVMDVGTTTGHNFGALPDAKVGGSGRLRVSATGATAVFPGGDFGSFLQENGGTVEYYTNTVGFAVPTSSSTVIATSATTTTTSTLALNSYKNLWVNAAAGLTVTLPNLDLRVFSQLKAGTSAGTGTVLLSTDTNGNLRADSLIAVQAGVLRYPNGTVARALTADTDVRIDANATLDVSSSGTAVPNTLTLGGSLTNNGTLDFNPGNSLVASLTFLGSQNARFTGPSGTKTNLATLTLNKGLGQAATLSVDVAGTLTTPGSDWLTLTNGTLRYAKTAGTQLLTIHNANTPYLIPSSAGLTMDAPGATVTVATSTTAPGTNLSSPADLKLAGTLQVLQGNFNVGTVQTGTAAIVGNDLEYASAGAPTIRVGTGGTLYVNGQIRRTTANTNGSLRYDQSGGNVEIRGARAEVYQNNERGLFEVQGPGSIFRMSGGTLALRGTNNNPTIIADLYLRPDSTVVTAGTVLLGNTVSGNIKVSVESLVPLYDMRVENGLNASSTNTGLLTGVNPLSLQGSLTIGNDNAYFNANGLGLSIDRDLINNNNSANSGLANGGFQPGTAAQTTTFTGKGPVVQQVTSTLTTTTSNLTVFGGLVVNNAQTGGTLQLGRNARVIGTLTLAKGTLADNGQTLTSLGNIVNSATHTSATGGSLTLLGTANQNIDGNGKGKFGNVLLNNAAGATTLADQEITGVLTLTNGVLTIGSNLLNLTNTSTGAVAGAFSSTNFIRTNGIVADLGVRKSYATGAANFLFPIGAAAKYTPVRMNVTANSAAGTLTVQPIDLAHPSTTDKTGAKELTFYWKVRSTGFSNPIVTQVFSYVDNGVGNDVNGAEANYKLGRFLNGAWVPAATAGVGGIPGSVVDVNNNTLTNAAATYFDGDYTGGEPSEFGPVPTFYSRNSTAGQAGGASWDNPLAWTNNPDGSNPSTAFTTGPTLANPVVIRSGHLINGAATSNEAATLQLLGTLNLGTSTANNFNTVTGTGTVRIGSALFPAGNYAAFMDPTGGTVNYAAAGDVQLPARDTYNNLTFSGGNTNLLSNLDLTINGALNVAAGTTVTNPTNQGITLTSATSGATLNGTFNLNEGPLTTGAFVANGGTLNLGAGQVNIGTTLSNSGTLNNGSGAVAVGTALTNSGTYNANVGTGTLAVGTAFANNGTYNAGAGSLTIGGNFSNAANQSFTANTGNVLVAGSFSNAGSYTVADNVSGNLLRVAGDFSNLATGSFAAASSTLVLRGNFVNNNNFDAGLGLVQFINDESRRLTGTTTFYNMQKVGALALTLGTSTDVTVSNMLTLSNGLINTGTVNTLKLTNSTVQPIVGTSTSAYVAGRLAITMPTTVSIRVFPVGLGGRYRPVTLRTEDVSSEPQVILTEIFNGAPKGILDATLSNISANRSYRIQRLSGGTMAPVSVQLSFNTDVVDEEVHVPGNLRVAQSPNGAGPWSTAGGAGVFSPADPRGYTTSASSQTVLDNVSFFALASTNKVDNPLTGSAPLPVQLLSFTAARQGSAVRTAWATASEKNSAYFVVERSANSSTFSDVQRVAAQGNSLSRHDYTALDTQPLTGTSYYRLRQVDLDGAVTYSPVVAVRFDGALAAPALVVYPNPTAGQHFQVLATNLATTGGTVQLFDNLGRLVLTQVAAVGTAEALIQPAQALASGLYFVTWQTADGLKLTTKVVVE